ncbi:dihydroorotate dehydrogenase [Clostridium tetani]|uniref:DUF2325 domain-containing protein n=1 Tax=Clostridium tetani TaxID=1513 RepID=A0A4Q0VD93_CLOTA|nr:DUF2325 domain-containing protein [Clostridium tetani]AVP54918.1 DUF2325 domain-containing protein [Clostridium tetani]KGI37410.1 hypothetical protein LA33_11135 [Clostridium tetani ATCC 9441]KGI40814.1 hypothetical protein KY52_03455 [Clostridium tetani]KGI44290.1 hypothetical protein KY54_07695 [Clostridium tetani]KGI44424.1 hypothetical protein KY55_03470 [Clostridium tetani]
MSALVIGGDKLGKIRDELEKRGFNKIEHISGRKSSDRKVRISNKAERADMVLVLTDFINHGVVTNLKNNVNNPNVIFSRRAWAFVEEALNGFMNSQLNS